MASVNGNDFLTDPTGSRRFLPFEVLSIDIDRAIWVDMDRVYSEARTLLNNGFRYWFDDTEIEELHRGNAAFHVQTIEYEMLLKGFEKPPEHAVTDCFMTTVEILDYLRSYSSLNLSEKRMGEALRKAGFERRSKRIGGNPVYGWVIEKSHPTLSFLTDCSYYATTHSGKILKIADCRVVGYKNNLTTSYYATT